MGKINLLIKKQKLKKNIILCSLLLHVHKTVVLSPKIKNFIKKKSFKSSLIAVWSESALLIYNLGTIISFLILKIKNKKN